MSFAPLDSEMESYFDFDQGFHSPSMSRSPTSAFADTIDPTNMMAGGEEKRQVFNGPSHEYGRFRQLTGLPTGAVSNVSAYNDVNDGSFNFNVSAPSPSLPVGYSTGIDFDMDFGAGPTDPLPPYFFAGDNSGMNSNLNTQPPTPMSRNNVRLYPGMHSQQAEQARLEGLARQQRQQQMGQQLMRQRQSVSSSARPSISHAGGQGPADPVVEERITRLLDQMRHNSTAESIEDDPESPGGEHRSTRMRKDEEDMDEDERLLASEEGKKLSSKERRQLRNKVSARAFRSRRKEYIGQLEGEVAVKSQECNELKAKNRNLTEQNQQLSRLTQALLRHPAFNTFLNDMSNDPSILQDLQSAQQATGHFRAEKQEPTQQQSHDVQIQRVNAPQQNHDLSMMNLGSNHWNGRSSSFGNFQQPQVYSVLSIPCPALVLPNIFNLSGKPDVSEVYERGPVKVQAPEIERPFAPATETEECLSLPTYLDEGEFALFVDDMPSQPMAVTATSSNSYKSLGEKPSNIITLVVASSPVSDNAAIDYINTLFDSLVPTYERIGELTAHLP